MTYSQEESLSALTVPGTVLIMISREKVNAFKKILTIRFYVNNRPRIEGDYNITSHSQAHLFSFPSILSAAGSTLCSLDFHMTTASASTTSKHLNWSVLSKGRQKSSAASY
jgi:hypothetical protein